MCKYNTLGTARRKVKSGVCEEKNVEDVSTRQEREENPRKSRLRASREQTETWGCVHCSVEPVQHSSAGYWCICISWECEILGGLVQGGERWIIACYYWWFASPPWIITNFVANGVLTCLCVRVCVEGRVVLYSFSSCCESVAVMVVEVVVFVVVV